MAKLFVKWLQNSLYETNKGVYEMVVILVICLQAISKLILWRVVNPFDNIMKDSLYDNKGVVYKMKIKFPR